MMMRFIPGNIVRSSAGRDCGRLYVVIAVVEGRVLLADGRKRTISTPKPKNPGHLQLVRQGEPAATDEEIREFLHGLGASAGVEGGN